MPVNHKLKLIFIHIPKTAGTSIEYALGMHNDQKSIGLVPYLNQTRDEEFLFGAGLQHLTASKLKHRIGKEKYQNYFKFSIVRNPYDRFVSYVAWSRENKNEPLTRNEFNELTRRLKYLNLLGLNIMLKPQYQFITINNSPAYDFLIYYENLYNGIIRLEEYLNLSLNIDVRMKSSHHNFEYYYDKTTRKYIQKIYEKDFTYLGYKR